MKRGSVCGGGVATGGRERDKISYISTKFLFNRLLSIHKTQKLDILQPRTVVC